MPSQSISSSRNTPGRSWTRTRISKFWSRSLTSPSRAWTRPRWLKMLTVGSSLSSTTSRPTNDFDQSRLLQNYQLPDQSLWSDSICCLNKYIQCFKMLDICCRTILKLSILCRPHHRYFSLPLSAHYTCVLTLRKRHQEWLPYPCQVFLLLRPSKHSNKKQVPELAKTTTT